MKTARIDDLGTFVNGYAFKPEDWSSKGIPIIRIQNLTGTEATYNYYEGAPLSQYLVRQGDILISWSASLGVYIWGGSTALLNQHIFRADLRDGIDRSYFFYAMLNVLDDIKKQVHGATMQHITKDRFGAVTVPLPPLADQRRIAAILRAADDERRRRQYTQSLSDGLLGDIFIQMFGDLGKCEQVPLSELAAKSKNSFVNGPFGSDLLTTEIVQIGVPVIYVRDIASGRYQRVSSACVTPAKATHLDYCRVDPGDILIAKVGNPPGTAVMYPEGEKSGIVTQDVIRLKPSLDAVVSEYLVAYLNSECGRRALLPIIVEGTRERFGLTPLKQVQVPLPPKSRQKQFARIATAYENTRHQQQESARQADHLFDTLLHRAFTGDL